MERISVDTTVQPKNVAFPTNVKWMYTGACQPSHPDLMGEKPAGIEPRHCRMDILGSRFSLKQRSSVNTNTAGDMKQTRDTILDQAM